MAMEHLMQVDRGDGSPSGTETFVANQTLGAGDSEDTWGHTLYHPSSFHYGLGHTYD